jgi:hypothetical protein
MPVRLGVGRFSVIVDGRGEPSSTTHHPCRLIARLSLTPGAIRWAGRALDATATHP